MIFSLSENNCDFGDLNIYDITGNIIFKQNINLNISDPKIVCAFEIPDNGVYIITFKTNEKIFSGKMIY